MSALVSDSAAHRPAAEGDSRVTVLIVTYDSAADLPACLDAVAAQDHRPLELLVVDCASQDASVALARTTLERWRRAESSDRASTEHGSAPSPPSGRILPLDENLGFAGGMNVGLASSTAPFVLALNADARPRPDFVRRLLARAENHPRAAAITGRLVRPEVDGARLLDACGMVLLPSWRHLDRGSGEPDRGQLDRAERVFGATGAATLYRRAALDDVAFDDGAFDPLFHSYREDAELCFRFAARGWQVLYEPAAVAEHRRRVVPSNRRQLPAAINYHSLKNRYLLRAYHQTWRNAWRTALPTLWRDFLALGYVLLRERTSLRAYGWLWRHRRQVLERRRHVQGRKRVAEVEIDRWFRRESLPLETESSAPISSRSGERP